MKSEESMAIEGLMEDDIRLLSMPENKSGKKIYSRYSKFIQKYIDEEVRRDYDETVLVDC